MNAPLPTDALSALRQRLGDRFSTVAADRAHHGHGESYHPSCPPDAVAYALTTEEVAAVVSVCAAHRVPVIPFGAGTSLEGHVAALHGGIALDLSGMTRIIRVSEADLDCTVEAGVTRQQLDIHLRDTGLFFPVDPGAEATLGGMAATRASGTNAVRYGTMRDNVLGLTVVLADGSVCRTGGRARKSAAGYDLTRLFVGSEGTLGVITELTMRLQGIPEAIAAAVCAFPTIADAVATATIVVQTGIPVARMELLDESGMRAVECHAKLGYPLAPTLFFEFHGSNAGVEEQAEAVGAAARDHGAADFTWATSPAQRKQLWQARHEFHYASLAMRKGAKVWGTDVCVPISALAECIGRAHQDAAENAPFFVTTVGHVGDGNFHMGYLIVPDDPHELSVASALNERLVSHAIALGGTCTGEHGVGYGKTKYLETEHGLNAVATMRTLKSALDPHNLFNPGKVVPI